MQPVHNGHVSEQLLLGRGNIQSDDPDMYMHSAALRNLLPECRLHPRNHFMGPVFVHDKYPDWNLQRRDCIDRRWASMLAARAFSSVRLDRLSV